MTTSFITFFKCAWIKVGRQMEKCICLCLEKKSCLCLVYTSFSLFEISKHQEDKLKNSICLQKLQFQEKTTDELLTRRQINFMIKEFIFVCCSMRTRAIYSSLGAVKHKPFDIRKCSSNTMTDLYSSLYFGCQQMCLFLII